MSFRQEPRVERGELSGISKGVTVVSSWSHQRGSRHRGSLGYPQGEGERAIDVTRPNC